MNIDEMIAVLQAAKEGKQIQAKYRGDDRWLFISNPKDHPYNFWDNEFRVAPKPREAWVTTYPNGTMCVHPTLDAAVASVCNLGIIARFVEDVNYFKP